MHSDVAPDAPPDELDTLVQADAVAAALEASGIAASKAAFTRDREALKALIAASGADVIFNLVESIDGSGRLSALPPRCSRSWVQSTPGRARSSLPRPATNP